MFRRYSHSLTALALLGASLLVPATASAQDKPQVEVVFVLDTTGSMSGLINAAKQKIWSIVNEIASGEPTPDIKVGLIGYRDKGDAYITTRTDLTTDLDAIYEKLMAFSANGGGDSPEHVNQALFEAVHEMKWSQDRKTLKIIFLVGDAPPHMDYQDDVKYPKTCQAAVKREIIINTIQCGSYSGTAGIWRDIAHKSEGRYVAIAQSGGSVAVATPYDDELAELSAKLDGTYVGYGSSGVRQAKAAKMKKARALAKKAAPEAAAARASYRAKTGAIGSKDLVADLEAGRVSLDKVKEDQLPEAMRKMSKAERKAYLAKKKAERQQLRKKIAELSKKRSIHMKKEAAKAPPAARSFDSEVMEAVKEKAAKKGISYKK